MLLEDCVEEVLKLVCLPPQIVQNELELCIADVEVFELLVAQLALLRLCETTATTALAGSRLCTRPPGLALELLSLQKPRRRRRGGGLGAVGGSICRVRCRGDSLKHRHDAWDSEGGGTAAPIVREGVCKGAAGSAAAVVVDLLVCEHDAVGLEEVAAVTQVVEHGVCTGVSPKVEAVEHIDVKGRGVLAQEEAVRPEVWDIQGGEVKICRWLLLLLLLCGGGGRSGSGRGGWLKLVCGHCAGAVVVVVVMHLCSLDGGRVVSLVSVEQVCKAVKRMHRDGRVLIAH